MTPDTETMTEKFKKKYPKAEWKCRSIANNVDYYAQDISGIHRNTPIECTIDNQSRNCEGKCSLYKRSLIDLFFR